MMKQRVEKTHSSTAMFAALYRAVAQKQRISEEVGPDYLAEYFLPVHYRFFLRFKKIREDFKHKTHKLIPGMYEYILARTAFFDKVFRDALAKQTPQIVLLGAGYDTRPYRFSGVNQATAIFELDIAATQRRKRKCLKNARIDIPKDVALVPIDFNRESLRDVLENAGHDRRKQSLFIWEGVSYYLEPSSVDATLRFVKEASPHESAIAFDYAISIGEEQSKASYGAREFFHVLETRHSNEPFKFALKVGEVAPFLAQRGFKVVTHLNSQEIETSYLARDNGASQGKVNGVFRFAIASSNNAPPIEAH